MSLMTCDHQTTSDDTDSCSHNSTEYILHCRRESRYISDFYLDRFIPIFLSFFSNILNESVCLTGEKSIEPSVSTSKLSEDDERIHEFVLEYFHSIWTAPIRRSTDYTSIDSVDITVIDSLRNGLI